MSHLTPHITEFMQRVAFPAEAVDVFTAVYHRLDENAPFAEKFDKTVNDYMFPEAGSLGESLKAVEALAEQFGENAYTLTEVFLLSCTEELLRRYRERGISDDIYWDTMYDFHCKLLECMECEGVPGTFVGGWYEGFLKMTRFAYGRFQYEITEYSPDESFTTKCGMVLKKGMPLVNFHIPSSGISLTDDVRLDSYKRAFGHFKDLFGGGPVPFVCGSWLLFPKHREFLPENSNILRFMDDFELISSSEDERFGNDWRVFGRYSDLPYEDLPEDTSLRKAYKKWLCAGNKTGGGFGVIVFDGEKILR